NSFVNILESVFVLAEISRNYLVWILVGVAVLVLLLLLLLKFRVKCEQCGHKNLLFRSHCSKCGAKL
ncbi:hypothetical protein DRJ48_01740, partial [Candidatus Woesearchaeota archaeon]